EEDDPVPQQPLEQLVADRHEGGLRRALDWGRCRGPQGMSHSCVTAPVTSGLIDWTITPPRNPIVPHRPLFATGAPGCGPAGRARTPGAPWWCAPGVIKQGGQALASASPASSVSVAARTSS